ncbi:MAG: aconitate hydratase, partial [Thermodesulfobacteriota bacterium]|nr:aconitate hydratase [Thermodesulfobacteriota bacterium]
TDPASWGEPPAKPEIPENAPDIRHLFLYPSKDGSNVQVSRGPNIVALEKFPELPESISSTVLLKVGDDITTDHILPAGPEILALRSNIPAISEFIFSRVDKDFVSRIKNAGGGVIVGGENYGQGSSREHAALGPRHLGVAAVIVKSLARIHRANLVNFGVLPLILKERGDYEKLEQGLSLTIPAGELSAGGELELDAPGIGKITVVNDLTEQELAVIRAGGLLNYVGREK